MSVVVSVPGKVLWFGDHMVHACGGIVSAVDTRMTLTATYDRTRSDGLMADDVRLHNMLKVAEEHVHAYLSRDASSFTAPPLPFRVTHDSDIPESMGLGSSSAATVACVALILSLRGRTIEQSAVLSIAQTLERAACDSSGIDTVACVYGGTHLYTPSSGKIVALDHFPKSLGVLYRPDHPHTCGCSKVRAPDILAEMSAIIQEVTTHNVPERTIYSHLCRAHKLLSQCGLSSKMIDDVCLSLCHAKVTGRGGGGAVLVPRDSVALTPVRTSEFVAWRPRPLAVCERGMIVTDCLWTVVPPHIALSPPPEGIACRSLQIGMSATGEAHPNIALVKYWGKRATQLADNSSVSLDLPYMTTKTRVCIVGAKEDAHAIDDRVTRFVQTAIGDRLPADAQVSVVSESNFPRACGIASSASGFAALSRALAALLGDGLWSDAFSKLWIEQWSRLGSGSAVRSTLPGLVSWTGAVATEHKVSPEMRLDHMLVVFDPFPKETSSSSGHELAATSLFHGLRSQMADGNVRSIVDAFRTADFETIKHISEAEAVTMHMVMATSFPPIVYLTDEALSFTRQFVRFRNDTRTSAFFTIDAGCNIHLLWKPDERDVVLGFVRSQKHMFTLFRGVTEHRYRVLLLSGKRYAGKTTLAERLQRLIAAEQLETQFINISDSVKQSFCSVHGIDFEELMSTRSTKERYRREMIQFMEERRASDGNYVWCREAWKRMRLNPRIVVVTDARRPCDVDFFRTSSDVTYVRIECCEKVRQSRGWEFESGIDDTVSETGLDGVPADVTLHSGTFGDSDVRDLLRRLT